MRTLFSICLILMAISTLNVNAKVRYGQKLCTAEPQLYKCLRVESGQSWNSLFSDPDERSMVKHVNRMNLRLRTGMVIAVPKRMNRLDMLTLAPFESYYPTEGKRTIIFEPSKLAWAAYDEEGQLVRWGAASGGKNYCPDTGHGCLTVKGSNFHIYRKAGVDCKSGKFPIGKGGAPMPYCMFFYRGYAFHGSSYVPGYHASHGCVRIFTEDARWLHNEFVNVTSTLRHETATRVKVKHY